MRIGVIGGGVVGKATARAFVEHAQVHVYDLVKELSTHTLEQTLDTDLIFVCLPTPMMNDGRCDLSYVYNFFRARHHDAKDQSYVLRSTVPIGTTKKLVEQFHFPNLVHSPEFLTARCAVTDAQMPSRNIIGYPDVLDGQGMSLLNDLYINRFPSSPLRIMSSDESEAVKLFLNGFFAVKIAYFNECRTLADKLGMTWDSVINGILGDGRISHNHTSVPGPDGRRGFGGSCLPKDLANLALCHIDANLKPEVALAAMSRNKKDRAK